MKHIPFLGAEEYVLLIFFVGGIFYSRIQKGSIFMLAAHFLSRGHPK